VIASDYLIATADAVAFLRTEAEAETPSCARALLDAADGIQRAMAVTASGVTIPATNPPYTAPLVREGVFWVAAQVAVSEDCWCAVVLKMLSYTNGDMEGKAKAAREAMRLVAPTIDVFLWSSKMVGSPGPEIGQGQAVRRALAAAKAIEAEVRRQWPDALPCAV
jgi:hypothetical protein